MTYRVKIEKLDELKNGRTCKYIAEKCDCTSQYVSKLFSGKSHCSKALAFLLATISNNSQTENLSIDEKVEFYFDKIEN